MTVEKNDFRKIFSSMASMVSNVCVEISSTKKFDNAFVLFVCVFFFIQSVESVKAFELSQISFLILGTLS